MEDTATKEDFLVLGHLVKYNLYLLAKAQIFAALSQSLNVNEAIAETHRVIGELDLDTKRRAAEAAMQSEQNEAA
mgnify:CR=1 FL=1|jgi:hypothetical protein